MGTCKIDHPIEDVQKKLADQKTFLPSDLYENTKVFLEKPLTQLQLNELFHLLKKYDLAPEEEKQIRNEKIKLLIT